MRKPGIQFYLPFRGRTGVDVYILHGDVDILKTVEAAHFPDEGPDGFPVTLEIRVKGGFPALEKYCYGISKCLVFR